LLLKNGELAVAIEEHLRSIGKHVKATDIVSFLNSPDIKEKYGLTKTIAATTA